MTNQSRRMQTEILLKDVQMKADITSILETSENLKEDLLAVGDEIWDSIDHNDSASLEEGVRVKVAFNQAVEQFTDSIAEVTDIVDNYSPAKPDPAPETTTVEDKNRVVEELDHHEPHRLDEEFAYRRPYGFRLSEYAVSDTRTWRRLYEVACSHFADRFDEQFASLPASEDFVTSHGNTYFSTDAGELRTPAEVADGIYAEVHFSADDIASRIRELLEFFGEDWEKFEVYLREDRDA